MEINERFLVGRGRKIQTLKQREREKRADTSGRLHQCRAYNRQNPPKQQAFDFLPLIYSHVAKVLGFSRCGPFTIGLKAFHLFEF